LNIAVYPPKSLGQCNAKSYLINNIVAYADVLSWKIQHRENQGSSAIELITSATPVTASNSESWANSGPSCWKEPVPGFIIMAKAFISDCVVAFASLTATKPIES
jgi:hypothetical protein